MVLAATSAPFSTSTFAAAALFSRTAHMSAVWPYQPSLALTLAPCPTSTLTASALPFFAAAISIVSPSE